MSEERGREDHGIFHNVKSGRATGVGKRIPVRIPFLDFCGCEPWGRRHRNERRAHGLDCRVLFNVHASFVPVSHWTAHASKLTGGDPDKGLTHALVAIGSTPYEY